MKGISEIQKLLWLINSVLIVILLYIVVSFISANNAGKSAFAYPVTKKEKVEIVPFERPLSPVEHKAIIEHNIFGSPGLNADRKYLQRKDNHNPLSALKARFRLCATVAGDSRIACAVIEDLKSRRQDIYKTGEIFKGARVERIDRNKIILFYEGRLEVLNLHITRDITAPVEKDEEPVIVQKQDETEFVNDIIPFEMVINNGAFTMQVPKLEVFLEKVELSPYIIDGQEEGLCITGLDDLRTAGYFGFENGDVIQNVNGQMLTNKQKAFQVLKKARSQSQICVQLLRDQRKVELSFDIK